MSVMSKSLTGFIVIAVMTFFAFAQTANAEESGSNPCALGKEANKIIKFKEGKNNGTIKGTNKTGRDKAFKEKHGEQPTRDISKSNRGRSL